MAREVLHGESGAGKTVVAWRICDEVRDRGALPWQVLMHGSSVLTLRAELARFARMHVPGLAEDAKEEEVVEAARQALASGWLLLVDDVGPDLEGVLVRCSTHARVPLSTWSHPAKCVRRSCCRPVRTARPLATCSSR